MSSIRSISRIEPAQLALVSGIIYGVFGVIVFCLMFLSVSMVSMASMPMMGAWRGMASGAWLILMPVLYAVLGYISGFIGALVYNLVAKAVGGIKVTVSD